MHRPHRHFLWLLAAAPLLLAGYAASAAAWQAANQIELVMTYGSEKEEWLKEVNAAFNAAGVKVDGKTVKITAIPMGSGESIDEVYQGRRKAHLVSPASKAYIVLGNAVSQAAQNKPLVGKTQSMVISPMVIAM